MRRFIVIGCYFLVLITTLKGNRTVAQESSMLPVFSFESHDGRKITDLFFRNDRPLIILYFEPGCSHCRQQAEWIAGYEGKFKHVDFLWVAWEPTDLIMEFKDQYFPQGDNVYFAIDRDGTFDSIFGFSQIPTVFVYTDENRLLRKFKKETRAEKLLKTLQSSD